MSHTDLPKGKEIHVEVLLDAIFGNCLDNPPIFGREQTRKAINLLLTQQVTAEQDRIAHLIASYYGLPVAEVTKLIMEGQE